MAKELRAALRQSAGQGTIAPEDRARIPNSLTGKLFRARKVGDEFAAEGKPPVAATAYGEAPILRNPPDVARRMAHAYRQQSWPIREELNRAGFLAGQARWGNHPEEAIPLQKRRDELQQIWEESRNNANRYTELADKI